MSRIVDMDEALKIRTREALRSERESAHDWLVTVVEKNCVATHLCETAFARYVKCSQMIVAFDEYCDGGG